MDGRHVPYSDHQWTSGSCNLGGAGSKLNFVLMN
jgi:hypothetical protein